MNFQVYLCPSQEVIMNCKQRAIILISLIGITLFLSNLLLFPPSVAADYISGTRTPQAEAMPHTILAAPDLIIESIAYSPELPDIGTSVDITVTIKNQGDAAASGFYTHLYVDPVDQPPNATTAYTSRTYLGVPLNPGASYLWVRTGQTFATEGNHPVYAWVDRYNTVAESDETNNLTGPVNICIGGDCNKPILMSRTICVARQNQSPPMVQNNSTTFILRLTRIGSGSVLWVASPITSRL